MVEYQNVLKDNCDIVFQVPTCIPNLASGPADDV